MCTFSDFFFKFIFHFTPQERAFQDIEREYRLRSEQLTQVQLDLQRSQLVRQAENEEAQRKADAMQKEHHQVLNLFLLFVCLGHVLICAFLSICIKIAFMFFPLTILLFVIFRLFLNVFLVATFI